MTKLTVTKNWTNSWSIGNMYITENENKNRHLFTGKKKADLWVTHCF